MKRIKLFYLLVGIGSLIILNILLTFKKLNREQITIKLSKPKYDSVYSISKIESNGIINLHNYTYLTNAGSNICQPDGDNIIFVAMIQVTVTSFKRRLIIRSSWANRSLFPKLRYVFMLGKSQNETINQKIKNENDIYGDIVQEVLKLIFLKFSKSNLNNLTTTKKRILLIPI
jgi:hypothetical protein